MANNTTFETINIDDFIHEPINQERVQSYPPELVGRFNSFIVTAFDDSMTVEMQIRTLIKWIKENIDVTTSALDNMEAFKQDSMAFQNHVKNTLVNLINQFTDKFDDNLKAETLEILTNWFNDGLLSDLVRIAINEEVINARGDKNSLSERLDESDDKLLNINNEVIDARGGKDTLGQRLDETTTKLAQTEQNLNDLFLNVTNVPEPLEPILFDGTDETIKLQNILDYSELNHLNVFIPAGTVYIGAIYVPNNVYLKGAGKYKTILKLPDNFEGVNTRQPTGIMTKNNVDFYRVGHLTYDGNALNNIVLDDLEATDFLNYQSNGLCNFYNASPVADDGILPEKQYAKDFIYEEVYVKEVIRNGLLIGGRANKRGTVLNVTIENTYLDHHIYETNTNTDVDYTNIEFKGTTRGGYIVTQGGTFNNLDFKDLEQHSHYNREGIVNVRARVNMDKQAIFNNVNIRTDFEDMNQIFLVQKNRENNLRGASLVVNDIEITQTDNIQRGIYGQPVTLVESAYGEKIHFTGVRAIDVMAFRLLYAQTSTEDVKFEDVSVRYSDNRTTVLPEDSVIAFVNTVHKNNTYKNIRLKNVVYHGIAPTLFNFRVSSSEPVVIDGLHIEDSFFKSNGSENLNNMDVATLVTIKDFWFKHSTFNDYAGNTISQKTIRTYGLQLEDIVFNNKNSRAFKDFYVLANQTTRSLPHSYVFSPPRKVSVVNLSNDPANMFVYPKLTFANNEMTVEIPSASSTVQGFYIETES